MLVSFLPGTRKAGTRGSPPVPARTGTQRRPRDTAARPSLCAFPTTLHARQRFAEDDAGPRGVATHGASSLFREDAAPIPLCHLPSSTSAPRSHARQSACPSSPCATVAPSRAKSHTGERTTPRRDGMLGIDLRPGLAGWQGRSQLPQSLPMGSGPPAPREGEAGTRHGTTQSRRGSSSAPGRHRSCLSPGLVLLPHSRDFRAEAQSRLHMGPLPAGLSAVQGLCCAPHLQSAQPTSKPPFASQHPFPWLSVHILGCPHCSAQ